MADTVYSMNQYRYNGGNTCMTLINSGRAKYLDWKIETDTSPFYRDIVFDINAQQESSETSQTLIANTPYYFRFAIPRDINYDLDISIKLLKEINPPYSYKETSTSYQFIKYISNRRISSKGTHNNLVVLYQLDGENIGKDVSNTNHARTALQSYLYPGINPIPQLPTYSNPELQTVNNGQFLEVLAPPVGYIYYEKVLYHNKANDTYWMFKDITPNNSCKAIQITGAGGPIGPKTDASDNPTGLYYLQEDPFGTEIENVFENIVIGTNDVILNWSWDSSSGQDIAYYDCIITPAENGFKYILLQLQRITEDLDILANAKVGAPQQMCINQPGTAGYGENINGRMINLEQIIDQKIIIDEHGDEQVEKTIIQDTFKLYKLNELNSLNGPLSSNTRTIKRFGIWGHPELMMAINGEEVRIGQSGYYELNDFDVNSICVVADGLKDTFVLDYQYMQD